MKTAAVLFVVLAAVANMAAALPNYWKDSTYRNQVKLQQSAGSGQCSVIQTGTVACMSTRVTVSGRHSYVHICPKDSSSKFCINSKLPRCCESDALIPTSGLTCVSTTKLPFPSQEINVKIYQNSEGEHCIHVDDSTIGRCCQLVQEPVLSCLAQPTEPPSNPPLCSKQRDVHFLLDATDSLGEGMFCRLATVLQLIVAAINQRGIETARVSTILYQSENSNNLPTHLFNLDDQCSTIVNTVIPQVVFEYYAVGDVGLKTFDQITFKNVRATGTFPISAMKLVKGEIELSKRPASVVILTDGNSHQLDLDKYRDAINATTEVLISAGIGGKVSEDGLKQLAPINIYEPSNAKVFDFAKRIITKMYETGALCADEASRIQDALDKLASDNSDIGTYCSTSCLFSEDLSGCSVTLPVCGASDITIQAIQKDKLVAEIEEDFEKELLKEEVLQAVEKVISAYEEEEHRAEFGSMYHTVR